jgi:hypothetical protein
MREECSVGIFHGLLELQSFAQQTLSGTRRRAGFQPAKKAKNRNEYRERNNAT